MELKTDPIYQMLSREKLAPRPRRRASTQTELHRAFLAFHRDNPQVYALFCRFTQAAVARGCKNFSVASIIERIRWETEVETTGGEFKIGNNHRAYYARMWMADNPDHAGFFRTRPVRGQEGEA